MSGLLFRGMSTYAWWPVLDSSMIISLTMSIRLVFVTVAGVKFNR